MVQRENLLYICHPPHLHLHQTIITQNLFPVQIENALTAHPLIREAAAVAVPDERYGEVVGAWIVRETGNSKDAARLSRGEVRRAVTQDMNPQVRF